MRERVCSMKTGAHAAELLLKKAKTVWQTGSGDFVKVLQPAGVHGCTLLWPNVAHGKQLHKFQVS